jgi:ParB family chromosome partitioning protein
LAGAFFLELARIRPDPAQPRRRLDTAQQTELTNSVRQLGVLQPIAVRYLESENIYQIISGERRFHASHAAGLLEIPCWVQSPQAKDILLHQIVENWQRADLEPFEIADSLLSLKEANGYTQKQLAELVGKSEGEVSKLLSLLTLDPAAQSVARADKSGRYSRRHLLAAVRLTPLEQKTFLERMRKEELTAEKAEEFVQSVTKPKATDAPKRGAPVTRIKFTTREATVVLTFRKKTVTPEMIEGAFEEVRQQLVEKPKSEVRIVRAKH